MIWSKREENGIKLIFNLIWWNEFAFVEWVDWTAASHQQLFLFFSFLLFRMRRMKKRRALRLMRQEREQGGIWKLKIFNGASGSCDWWDWLGCSFFGGGYGRCSAMGSAKGREQQHQSINSWTTNQFIMSEVIEGREKGRAEWINLMNLWIELMNGALPLPLSSGMNGAPPRGKRNLFLLGSGMPLAESN